MDFMHQYVLEITSAVIICGLLTMLFHKTDSTGIALRFVAGLFMTIAIVSPFTKIHLKDYSTYWDDLLLNSQSYITDGTQFYEESIRERITEQTQTYILDKAANMDIDIQAVVSLSNNDTPVPVSVEIRGNLSPVHRQRLSDVLRSDLNITKENIIWTSNP